MIPARIPTVSYTHLDVYKRQGHKSQKYVKYHYKRNVYNWQCVMKRNLKGMVISNELVQNMSNNYIAINEQVRDFA